MKVEVYILHLIPYYKVFIGTLESPKREKILREIDKCLLMQELTIWFSEKTPGTLHQNKIVYEETTRKIHILIHKSYIGIEIIVNFENLQMHKYIPEREHFSVYQMMIHSAIWKERESNP
ncbi:hypothetical protein ACJX0J_005038 [Zea mays]